MTLYIFIMTDQAHSMCVSLRLDQDTLKAIEQERGDKTLSATMNTRICGALSTLASKAKEGVHND